MTITELASSSGLSKMQIWHLVHVRRGASFKVAFAIEHATGGYVDASMWLEPLR